MPTCQGRYAPPEAVALLPPPARTILKYALFYHGNREFTENSEHSPKGSSLRLHLTLTNIICLSFIPDDGRSSFCSSVQSQSFISVDSGILLWATLFHYHVLGLLYSGSLLLPLRFFRSHSLTFSRFSLPALLKLVDMGQSPRYQFRNRRS